MGKIEVKVNPYLELMNSILLTSKYNQITTPYVGYGLMTSKSNEYIKAIKAKFRDYTDSPIYQFIEKMIPHGFTFSRPVELMLSLGKSNDFTMQFTPSDLCTEYCGGMNKIKVLLRYLKDFESEIDYFTFFNSVKHYYKPFLDKVKEHVNSYSFVTLIENEYGRSQNSYNFILSDLMIGNFGIHFYNKNNGADIFPVFMAQEMNQDDKINEFSGGALSANIIFHELSHPFINSLTDKYFDIANECTIAYESLKKYKLPNFSSGYGDWPECINEHFVRAMAIHLLKKCNRHDWAEEYLKADLHRGYRYIPEILERYEYYDNNRIKYKTLDEFYPELLGAFKMRID